MSNILADLPGIVCHIDDVLVFHCDQREHDSRLKAALRAIQQAGLTSNIDKCVFNQSCVSFFRYHHQQRWNLLGSSEDKNYYQHESTN